MNRIVLGAFIALLMVGVGLFWLQGRAEVEKGAPPPDPGRTQAGAMAIPTANVAGMRGPAPPVASGPSREQQRFFRYDRDHDGRITRNEMLSTRTAAFRKLDKDGNNLLSFEEWAVTTVDRFQGADKNHDGILTPAEFAATAPPPKKAEARCACGGEHRKRNDDDEEDD